MKRPVLIVLVSVLTILGCAACYESAFPIDATPQADVEQALVGVWRCVGYDAKATDRPATLTIGRGEERRYAVTLQEDGRSPDRYEAYASSIAGEVVFNLRDVSSGGKPWTFVRQTLVRPNLLHLQVLDEKALTAQESPAALRTTLERLHDQPNAFEDLCACVRARPE